MMSDSEAHFAFVLIVVSPNIVVPVSSGTTICVTDFALDIVLGLVGGGGGGCFLDFILGTVQSS